MRLVKILEDAPDVSALTEGNISEYLQAVRTAGFIASSVVDPFEETAKGKGPGVIYETPGLKVQVQSRTTTQGYSARDVLMLLEGTLATAVDHQARGKQMYGVRAFGDVPAMDAGYLLDTVRGWQDAELGSSVSLSVGYKGKAAPEIARANLGRILLGERPTGLAERDATLFVAGSEQVASLEEKVIQPFEKVFKKQAATDPSQTVFDRHDYGSLTVLVKTVPRMETNYDQAVQMAVRVLDVAAAGRTDGSTMFLNESLAEPRVYVSIPHLQRTLETMKAKRTPKQRQEISVLHRPEDLMLITA